MQLVRVGTAGRVGRFRSAEGIRHARSTRVIVRTTRGLEIGQVLADAPSGPPDGDLLRAMTPQDELLAQRLASHAGEAFDACARLLEDRGVDAVLTDAELLFDGRGLCFHFLGDPPPEAEAITAELAGTYEATAQIGRFAETLERGCGPGCGTQGAPGQGGCHSCGSCALAGACKP